MQFNLTQTSCRCCCQCTTNGSSPTNSSIAGYPTDSVSRLLLFCAQCLIPVLRHITAEPSIFSHREFSFTLTDDIYLRYMSFESPEELEKEICSRNPYKIDIGPVMSIRPKEHRTISNIKAMQRELVFDIDMTDYDEIRTCCQKADVCTKCWKFMAIACQVIDGSLREDFGFEHLLWVFSGRRGIHCWVCDKAARHLDGKNRTAIAEYLHLISGGGMGENCISRVAFGDKMHYSIKRAYTIIKPLFEEIVLVEQDLFATKDGVAKLLSLIPDEATRGELKARLAKTECTSRQVWETVTAELGQLKQKGPMSWSNKYLIEEIMFALTYPRLDINVSKGINHLLKAPFCIHPKTGKICSPFHPNSVTKFDPTTVPHIKLIIDEINAFDKKNAAQEDAPEEKLRIKDYKKTSMFKGIVVFEEFLRKLENSFKGSHIKNSDLKLEF